jgi:hypothetical protein
VLAPVPLTILQLASALAFLGYGLSCLFTSHMEQEFKRYGLSKFRRLTGALEVAGGAGLLVGFVMSIPTLTLFAALGLSLLMAMGLIVRLRLRDTLLQCLPALILLVVNAMLVVGTLIK